MTAFLAAGLAGALLQAQDGGLNARTLYYNSGSDTEAKPAAKHTAAASKPKAGVQTVAAVGNGDAPKVAPPATVTHLGVRYNVLLIDPKSNEERLVDVDRKFEPNECLALRVQSNYDGYLYVIDHGSTGKWEVMLPSAEMPEQGNFVAARTALKIPAQYCFNIDSSGGTEDLYLVFSRNQEDVYDLNSAIKSQAGQSAGSSAAPVETETASSKIGTQLARLERMQSRDLTVKKVAKPVNPDEPANSVYVVNTSRTPSDRIVTQIQIKH